MPGIKKSANRFGSGIFDFIYCVTVTLAVEILRLGIILLILGLLGAAVVSLLGSAAWWMYTQSQGSLTAVMLALCVSIMAVCLLGYIVQYITRDVLHLTNFSLPELVIYLAKLVYKGHVSTNAGDKKTEVVSVSKDNELVSRSIN